MSLVDDLKALSPKKKPQGCKTCAWLEGHPREVGELVRQWAQEDNSPLQLHRTLKAHGYPLSESALKGHIGHCYDPR